MHYPYIHIYIYICIYCIYERSQSSAGFLDPPKQLNSPRPVLLKYNGSQHQVSSNISIEGLLDFHCVASALKASGFDRCLWMPVVCLNEAMEAMAHLVPVPVHITGDTKVLVGNWQLPCRGCDRG